ncbi:MAG: tRNA (adenosine(37)-N6)-threonylcarbamoyltransferase complex ATPase subunit type 1 TsaE [Candidatus Abyssobacteria bacterium SURF_17]|uniref:tRNA threonylcarbamoyladenosine biosynthesis protein TsaE n=1 Tax=Candidatus Abyssobacteria bacterium SURF_17 TaxID=2093361 RepID=A0A419EX11_9BACT|nr:MAG: tRNA (adenosine(37)-N6)-threonylcarbamoyltransferase complex ATPase subunit type 1 TsaE [Candidatus Abyssubacteria bacterium SURF_17]
MLVISRSPEQTRDLGERLGRVLGKGSVVALVGELGSGKTVLAQGLARGLDVGPDEYVSSPSFALVNEYRGRVPVFHVDTYRLYGVSEMVALGYEDLLEPEGVTIIEWADKVRELLPERHLLVELSIVDSKTRRITISLVGPWETELRARIGELVNQETA